MAIMVAMALLAAAHVTPRADAQESTDEAPATPEVTRVLASSTAERVWLATFRSPNELTLHYRDAKAAAGRLYPVLETTGPEPTHIAANGASLYIAYTDRSVQSVGFVETEPMGVSSLRSRALPPLPADTTVLAWSASEQGPVAVVEGGSASDRRLLRVINGRWDVQTLPATATPRRVIGLAVLDADAAAVGVASASTGGDEPRLRIDHYEDGWTIRTYDLAIGSEGRVAGAARNLYAIRAEAEPGGRRLVAYLLRGGDATRLGDLAAFDGSGRWDVNGTEEHLCLTTIEPDGTVGWAARPVADTWTGPETLTRLEPRQTTPLPFDPTTLAIAAITIAIIVLLSTAGRRPEANTQNLPEHLRVAEAQRLAAAVVDLGISMSASMGLTPLLSPEGWHLYGPEWSQAILGLTVIACHVTHTTIGEVFTARSIGKSLFNCRVTDLHGEPPNVWQAITRNLFKVFEMIIPLLLIVPMLNPARQRLGDILAQTLVVSEVEPDQRERDETP